MKIALVACGWHYPSHFYKSINEQHLPIGYELDLFVVGHRHPNYSHGEKKLSNVDESLLNVLDHILYEEEVTLDYLKKYNWTYIEGESGCEWQSANTWLNIYDYTLYDCLIFCGDDALIINDHLIYDVLTNNCSLLDNIKINDKWTAVETDSSENWLVITNSRQPRELSIRGSFEFFKPEALALIGGKFDLSKITLSRKGEVTSPTDPAVLSDWNNHIIPFIFKFRDAGMYNRIKYLSNFYRASDYILECERGLLQNGINSPLGQTYLNKIISLYNEGKLKSLLTNYQE